MPEQSVRTVSTVMLKGQKVFISGLRVRYTDPSETRTHHIHIPNTHTDTPLKQFTHTNYTETHTIHTKDTHTTHTY